MWHSADYIYNTEQGFQIVLSWARHSLYYTVLCSGAGVEEINVRCHVVLMSSFKECGRVV